MRAFEVNDCITLNTESIEEYSAMSGALRHSNTYAMVCRQMARNLLSCYLRITPLRCQSIETFVYFLLLFKF